MSNRTAALGLAAVCIATLAAAIPPQQAAAATGQAQTASAQLTDKEVEALRADLRSDKKQAVAANLKLTDKEAETFWPVYDRYAADAKTLNDAKLAVIQQYADNYEAMTDAQAHDLMVKWLNNDLATAQLRLTYVQALERVLPAKKAARFLQIDRRIGLVTDVIVADAIPMVK